MFSKGLTISFIKRMSTEYIFNSVLKYYYNYTDLCIILLERMGCFRVNQIMYQQGEKITKLIKSTADIY